MQIILDQPPAVSVVIPLYNQRQYLSDAVSSVLSQTKQDFEILIIDDGSTDDPSGILELLKDSRIRYIRQENAGLSAARNRGIRESRAELIAFLDADDIWCPDFLEEMCSFISGSAEIGVAFCLCNFVDQHGMSLSRGPRPPVSRMSRVSPYWLLRSTPHGCGSTLMIRKSLIDSDLAGFDESLPAYEDVEFLLRVCKKNSTGIFGLNKVLVSYRIHGQSLSSQAEQSRSCLIKIAPKEDLASCLNFYERYQVQREVLTQAPRSRVLNRMLRSRLFGIETWIRDFQSTFLTLGGALLYIICPQKIFRVILKFYK